MAKGKKYRKWFEKHGSENRVKRIKRVKTSKQYSNEDISKELSHPVHGFMIYECEKCGAIFRMWLDKGLEDRVADAVNPQLHKPVPFCIGCRKCENGFAKHILWGIGDNNEYEEIPEGANYFENSSDESCGKPIISKEDARDREQFYHKLMSEKIGGRFA